MSDYEIIIHFRDSDEQTRIPLPGVSDDVAEDDRQTLMYEIEQARLAEAPLMSYRTKSGQPAEALTFDPHQVTEVDLKLAP